MDDANREFPPFPESRTGRRPHRVLLLVAGLGLPRDAVRDLGRRPRVLGRVRRALPRGRHRTRRSASSTTSSAPTRRCRGADPSRQRRRPDTPSAPRSPSSVRLAGRVHCRAAVSCFDRRRTRGLGPAANLRAACAPRCLSVRQLSSRCEGSMVIEASRGDSRARPGTGVGSRGQPAAREPLVPFAPLVAARRGLREPRPAGRGRAGASRGGDPPRSRSASRGRCASRRSRSGRRP